MKSKRPYKPTEVDYHRYLNGEMSIEEQYLFEKAVSEDKFESEALEGLESLEPHLLRRDLDSLRGNIRTAKNQKNWYWVAASISLLLAVGGIYFTLQLTSQESPVAESIPQEKVIEQDAKKEPGEGPAMESMAAQEMEITEEETEESQPVEPEVTSNEIATGESDVYAGDSEENKEQKVSKPDPAPSPILSEEVILEEMAEVAEVQEDNLVIAEESPIENQALNSKKESSGQPASFARSVAPSRKRDLKDENNFVISGKVVDENGQPIDSVLISSVELNVSFFSNEHGDFIINIISGDTTATLKFEKAGKRVVEIQANSEDSLEVVLRDLN